MIHYAPLLYFPGNPQAIFDVIDSCTENYPLEKIKFFLWVDNNDHKTSSEFYKLRKYIKKGVQIEVFINPPLGSRMKVELWLEAEAAKQGFFDHGNY